LGQLRWLIDRWQWYCSRAIEDPDLASLAQKVLAIPAFLRADAQSATSGAYRGIHNAQLAIKRAVQADPEGWLKGEVASWQSTVANTRTLLDSNGGETEGVTKSANGIVAGATKGIRQVYQRRIAALESRKNSLLSQWRSSHAEFERAGKDQSVAEGMGSVGCISFAFGLIVGIITNRMFGNGGFWIGFVGVPGVACLVKALNNSTQIQRKISLARQQALASADAGSEVPRIDEQIAALRASLEQT
jgi:hypothetical protein